MKQMKTRPRSAKRPDAAELQRLRADNERLRAIASEWHWMARRYVDGTSTGSVKVFNDLAFEAVTLGVKVGAGEGAIYARDARGRPYDGLEAALLDLPEQPEQPNDLHDLDGVALEDALSTVFAATLRRSPGDRRDPEEIAHTFLSGLRALGFRLVPEPLMLRLLAAAEAVTARDPSPLLPGQAVVPLEATEGIIESLYQTPLQSISENAAGPNLGGAMASGMVFMIANGDTGFDASSILNSMQEEVRTGLALAWRTAVQAAALKRHDTMTVSGLPPAGADIFLDWARALSTPQRSALLAFSPDGKDLRNSRAVISARTKRWLSSTSLAFQRDVLVKEGEMVAKNEIPWGLTRRGIALRRAVSLLLSTGDPSRA